VERIFVIGAGMTTFGPQPDVEAHELARRAVWEAIASSGVAPQAFKARPSVAVAGHAYQGPCFAQKTLMKIGLQGLPMVNVENACASGSTAIIAAAAMIRSGEAELAIAFGAEKLTRPGGGFLPIVADDLESAMGRVMPAAFAMQAQLHMRRHGTTREQMALVAVKNRRYGTLNPRCHFKDEVTVEQVLASPSIAEPLTRLSCCPVSDGAAAVILAGESALRALGLAPRVEHVASARHSASWTTSPRCRCAPRGWPTNARVSVRRTWTCARCTTRSPSPRSCIARTSASAHPARAAPMSRAAARPSAAAASRCRRRAG
jgi:acetyl-CoA acetyltransferase